MTLADFLADVEAERKTIVVYASEESRDVAAYFETRNVTLEHRSLPSGGLDGFVVIRDADGFVGAFGLGELAELLSPPIVRPWDCDTLTEPWRELYAVLDNTLFTAFDRRQLLGVTREIENRAWRIGDGTVRAGFQSASAYGDQSGIYRHLAAETDLSIHVYVDDWDQSTAEEPVVHSDLPEEATRYWFVVFDAAGDPTNAGAVLAEEREPGAFFGFWTYDPDRVDAIAASLQERYE